MGTQHLLQSLSNANVERLSHLDLNEATLVSGEDLDALNILSYAILPRRTSLQTLTLKDSEIEAAGRLGVTTLSRGLCSGLPPVAASTLLVLDLSKLKLGPKNAAVLATHLFPRCLQLRELYLGQTELSDEGVQGLTPSLAELGQLRQWRDGRWGTSSVSATPATHQA